MKVLGIDTATGTASVAIIDDNQTVIEKSYNKNGEISGNLTIAPQGNHAEIVLPLIRAVFDEAKLSLSELDGIAVSIGPGSFTGLRIALATVKGIAYEMGIPVIGISTLHAQACRIRDTDQLLCAMLDARKREVYAALFRRVNGILQRLSDDGVMPVNHAIEMIQSARQNDSCAIIGDGAHVYENSLLQSLGAQLRIVAENECSTVAHRVAELARARFGAIAGDDLGALVPIYLRSPEAERKRALSVLTH